MVVLDAKVHQNTLKRRQATCTFECMLIPENQGSLRPQGLFVERQAAVIAFHTLEGEGGLLRDADDSGWGQADILEGDQNAYLNLALCLGALGNDLHGNIRDKHIRPKLASCSVPGDFIGLDGEQNRYRNTNQAKTTKARPKRGPDSPPSSRVCCLPLGAQIGVSLVFALGTWLCLARAVSPFVGLVHPERHEVIKGISYAAASADLFSLYVAIWVNVIVGSRY